MRTRTLPSASIAVLCAGFAHATPHAELILLQDLPGAYPGMALRAVSPDGVTVTGEAYALGEPTPNDPQVVRFDLHTGEFSLLPAIGGYLRGASAGATTVFGDASIEDPWFPGVYNMFGWVYRDGDPERFYVPNQIYNSSSTVFGASGDGSTVVGMINFQRTFDPCCSEFSDAFFWDLNTMQAPQVLPDIAGGSGRTVAMAVSDDGQLFAGYAQFFDETATAVLWDRSGGTARVDVPGSDTAYFMTMSSSGRYLSGLAMFDPGSGSSYLRGEPFLFDANTHQVTVLGQTPGAFTQSVPTWVADDGSAVIGIFNEFLIYDDPNGDAFIWTETGGLERLIDHVEANYQGVSFDEFRSLRTAYSAGDGKTIVGNAMTQDGCCHVPYVLRLDVTPDCPPDLNGDGVVDADDFFLFLQLFADADTRADFNSDGVIDADDFFEFLNAFAQGC